MSDVLDVALSLMPVIVAMTASGSSSVMLLGVMKSHTDCEDAAVWFCDLKQLSTFASVTLGKSLQVAIDECVMHVSRRCCVSAAPRISRII